MEHQRGSTIAAIGGGIAIALFSYLGVEKGAVAAGKVRNPDRNSRGPPRTPFSDAANAMFGGTWAGNLMAIAVIISGFGALNGWAQQPDLPQRVPPPTR